MHTNILSMVSSLYLFIAILALVILVLMSWHGYVFFRAGQQACSSRTGSQ